MPTILSNDAGHRKAILKWLLAKGYKWHGENNQTPDIIEKNWPYSKWEVVQVGTDDKHICGNRMVSQDTYKSIFELSNELDKITGRRIVSNNDE